MNCFVTHKLYSNFKFYLSFSAQSQWCFSRYIQQFHCFRINRKVFAIPAWICINSHCKCQNQREQARPNTKHVQVMLERDQHIPSKWIMRQNQLIDGRSRYIIYTNSMWGDKMSAFFRNVVFVKKGFFR